MSLPAAEHGRDRPPRGALWAGLGGVTAAFLGSLCCAGPLLFVTLGVGAGLASTFEPLRPVFAAIMVGMFAVAFYAVYGRRTARLGQAPAGAAGPAASTSPACAAPRGSRRAQVVLWLALVLALVLWTFPMWSVLLL